MLTVHLPVTYNITGVITQRHDTLEHWLTTYELQYSNDGGATWQYVLADDGTHLRHAANSHARLKMLQDFRATIVASGLRFIDLASTASKINLRFELLGYPYG